MTTRKITIIALIAGIVLGVAATESFNVYRQSHDRQSQNSQIFQKRVTCKALADAYVKENTDLNDNSVTGRSMTVYKVDYSPARNSCVAEVETTNYFKGGALVFDRVQDLLSGKTLFSMKCAEGCEILQLMFFDPAFDYVMNNADEPVELEKRASALIESKSPPKSAPQIDPATGERIQPKSARPSGR